MHNPIRQAIFPTQYQFCIDAGVNAAEGFFDDLTAMGLHDHIAFSMHAFMGVAHAAAASCNMPPLTSQGCTDAFAAGYLGRIQQELRLFHGERRRVQSKAERGHTSPDGIH